jgi:hypothetical protein
VQSAAEAAATATTSERAMAASRVKANYGRWWKAERSAMPPAGVGARSVTLLKAGSRTRGWSRSGAASGRSAAPSHFADCLSDELQVGLAEIAAHTQEGLGGDPRRDQRPSSQLESGFTWRSW